MVHRCDALTMMFGLYNPTYYLYFLILIFQTLQRDFETLHPKPKLSTPGVRARYLSLPGETNFSAMAGERSLLGFGV